MDSLLKNIEINY